MNKHFLKIIRDNTPETLKLITAFFLRNRLIKNKEFLKYYNLLEERESLCPDSIKEYQFNQLKHILIHSYKNVPYYHQLFDRISFDPSKFSDFDQMRIIPFLTREIIQNNFDRLKSKVKVKNGFYIGKTGGSTGMQLKILQDFDSIFKENAFIYSYRKKLKYNFKDKMVTFRQIEFSNRLSRLNPMHNELIFFPLKISKKTIEVFAKKLIEFNPQYLNGYLSAIWYFTRLLDEYKIKPDIKLKGIFLTSENMDYKQRQFIEQFYNTESATFYGHTERCVIADEVAPNRYMFDPYYGYTEKVPLGNNDYLIVGTGFLNHTMPLIRYKTDDICSPYDQYYSIKGKRKSDVGLYGFNDEFLPNTTFDLDKDVFRNIISYQFIQKVKGKADLLIIVNNNFQIAEMKMIKDEIFSQTDGIIDIDIKIVENLILSPRGKYQMYVSTING